MSAKFPRGQWVKSQHMVRWWLGAEQALTWYNDDQDRRYPMATVSYKSGVKRLNTFGHLDQYMAQNGRIVKQSYCETV